VTSGDHTHHLEYLMPRPSPRERYFDAAIEILSEAGFRDLKMTALHRRLGLTSGSFYHHFNSWPDFVRQFLAYWTEFHTDAAVAAAVPLQDPVQRLEQMRVLATKVPHDAESAIRIWGAMDPEVARVQQDVDRKRLDLIRLAVVEATGNPDDADRLAGLALAIIVGYQQLGRPVDVDALDQALGQFNAMVLGGRSARQHQRESPEAPAGRPRRSGDVDMTTALHQSGRRPT
jgi:AcrR family transcriptional regulator